MPKSSLYFKWQIDKYIYTSYIPRIILDDILRDSEIRLSTMDLEQVQGTPSNKPSGELHSSTDNNIYAEFVTKCIALKYTVMSITKNK